MFIEKYGQAAWDRIKDPSEDPRYKDRPPVPEHMREQAALKMPGYSFDGVSYVTEIDSNLGIPYDIVAMHEQEHSVPQQRNKFRGGEDKGTRIDTAQRAAREMGPTIGDIVNTAATYRAKHGKPLDTMIKFPSGSINADVMAQWAYEHGYNQRGGPSMGELLFGTPEGRKWLKMMAGEKPMKSPKKLYPSLRN